MKNKEVKILDIGLKDYKEAWDYQTELFDSIVSQKIANKTAETKQKTNNYIVVCQHPHVYTLGKSGHESNLLINENALIEKNAQYFKINRGGDITYHGPGQLVVYPIIDLDNFFTDIHLYMRKLEEAVILTLRDFNIDATRINGLTGVWLENPSPRKICAMGVKASRWVTMHGLALNVSPDLNYFQNIVPCGISDKSVTSLEKELDVKPDFELVKKMLLDHILTIFEMKKIN